MVARGEYLERIANQPASRVQHPVVHRCNRRPEEHLVQVRCVYTHSELLSPFGAPRQCHQPARLAGWLVGWLVGWLADWLKPATLQSRTNEPRDCLERNWSTGTGVVLPRSWTSDVGSAGQLERYADPRCTLLVKYCTIKCRTRCSQSIPPYPSFSLSPFPNRPPRLRFSLCSFPPGHRPSLFLLLFFISLHSLRRLRYSRPFISFREHTGKVRQGKTGLNASFLSIDRFQGKTR